MTYHTITQFYYFYLHVFYCRLPQKRVVQRTQWYFTQKIDGTPFSLGIAMPDGYGKYKVHGQIELSRAIQEQRGIDGEYAI